VGSAHAGKTFHDTLGNHPGAVTINEYGWGEFKVNGGSVSVWVKDF
jgi:alpha-amylase